MDISSATKMPSSKLVGFVCLNLLHCMFVSLLLTSMVESEIPLGSKLTVFDNQYWVSSNGDFALGFINHTDLQNQYSVGIRFNSKSIPFDKQTVVWVVGADIIVSNSSYFQLTLEGGLLLYDSLNGGVVWSSRTTDKSVTSATLCDNGNFVLVNGDNDFVWQSFDYPSDTLLPGQNFSANEKLRAAGKGAMSSFYTLFMSDLGQLQLKWESNVIYWVNGNPVNNSFRASVSSNGSFELFDDRSVSVWSVYGVDHNEDVRFRFLRIDVDGNLRLYSWDERLSSWKTVWQAVEDQCKVFATCGYRGICAHSDSGNPVCKCPVGSPTESSSKCVVLNGHNCDTKVSMFIYNHTSLYGLYPPNNTVTIASLDQCQSLCLKEPLCTAVTYLNDGTALCRMKTSPYITGYTDPSLTSVSFVKTCLDPLAVFPHKSPSSSPLSPSSTSLVSHRSSRLVIGCLTGAVVGSVCLFFALHLAVGFWIFKKRAISVWKQASMAYPGSLSATTVRWSYNEIKELTGNFDNRLGQRTSKGTLQNNQPVVVKQLDASVEERKFRAMVAIVGSIYHRNLVKLEGYCCESDKRFLVYEYLKNGSLEDCLRDPKLSKRMNWQKRMSISRGVAKAISYLHTECREFVCHGNLKCANVILDENLEPKVTQYGLTRVNIEASNGSGAAEKDVEDFGKMVLALISGRQGDEYLCEWSYNKWISGYGWRVVDKKVGGEINFEELERALRIAYWCLQCDERMRPSMVEVVNVLEGSLSVDPPPPPFSCPKTLQEDQLTDSELEP